MLLLWKALQLYSKAMMAKNLHEKQTFGGEHGSVWLKPKHRHSIEIFQRMRAFLWFKFDRDWSRCVINLDVNAMHWDRTRDESRWENANWVSCVHQNCYKITWNSCLKAVQWQACNYEQGLVLIYLFYQALMRAAPSSCCLRAVEIFSQKVKEFACEVWSSATCFRVWNSKSCLFPFAELPSIN